MAWLYLCLAGITEIGWPLGFKLSSLSIASHTQFMWLVIAIISMALSGCLLYLAQRHIPIGTAYMVWTGIGAIGTFAIGILFFSEPLGAMRLLSAVLIVLGLILLKLSTPITNTPSQ